MSEGVGNSYWAIVGRQLRRNRLAMFGFWCVVGLFLLAIYAPVFAANRPYWYFGPSRSRISFASGE